MIILGIALLAGAGALAYYISQQEKSKPTSTIPSQPSAAPGLVGAIHAVANSTKSFANFMKPLEDYAVALGFKRGILTAHIAQETGYGKSVIGHNLWNIKASSTWLSDNKPIHEVLTSEYDVKTGQWYKTKAKFRAYPSYLDAVKDFIKLMQWSNYSYAWSNRNNPQEFFRGLMAVSVGGKAPSGYATDPKYMQNCMGVYNTIKNYI